MHCIAESLCMAHCILHHLRPTPARRLLPPARYIQVVCFNGLWLQAAWVSGYRNHYQQPASDLYEEVRPALARHAGHSGGAGGGQAGQPADRRDGAPVQGAAGPAQRPGAAHHRKGGAGRRPGAGQDGRLHPAPAQGVRRRRAGAAANPLAHLGTIRLPRLTCMRAPGLQGSPAGGPQFE